MSDIQTPSGQPDENLVGNKTDKKDVVAYETYQKTLSQEKAAKQRASELEAKLQELSDAQKAQDEAKLNEKGEFKKLLELREQELEKLKGEITALSSERDNYKGSLDDTHKLQAFYEKLPGKVKRQEYLGFVDLDSILVDPETGRPDQSSVQNVVSSFVENYGDLIENNNFGALPGDAPNSHGRKLTVKEWEKLPLKEKKSRMKEVDFTK